jgi:hypothetical protein
VDETVITLRLAHAVDTVDIVDAKVTIEAIVQINAIVVIVVDQVTIAAHALKIQPTSINLVEDSDDEDFVCWCKLLACYLLQLLQNLMYTIL